MPVFKTVTHLPPYLGMLFGLGVIWLITEIMHRNKPLEDKRKLTVIGILRKVDVPTIFCVLTDNTKQQSIDRSGGIHGNKGIECAIAAIKMASLKNNQ